MKTGNNPAQQLSGLPPDVIIDRLEKHAHSLELFVSWPEPGSKDAVCPRCGCASCVKKDNGAVQTLRHLPSAGMGTLVTFHKPRFLCRNCGRSFYVKPEWASPDMSITMPLFLEIYSKLTSTSDSLRSIAMDTMSSPSIIRNTIKHVSLGPPGKLPVSLGIDEFHGNTGTYNRDRKKYDTEKYHCVITDADNGAVIDILYKATFNVLKDYFMQLPLFERQQVKFFCTDLRSGFSKVARTCFPNAKICLDPFHVVKLLTDAISELRVEEWRRLRDLWRAVSDECALCNDQGQHEQLKAHAKALESDYLLVKNSQRLLVTSPYNDSRYWNRNAKLRDEKFERIYALSPDLKLAREALMEFYTVSHTELALRRSALTEWINAYISCECPPVKRAAGTIRSHRQGIENAWRFHKSNSPTEGLNKRIKDVKRMAFGAHDFQNFRKRAMLACGYVSFLPEPYTLFREKLTGPAGTNRPSERGGK